MKKLFLKISYAIPAIAMFMGVLALNSVCMATYHQQETPDSLNKYRI